ncbi:MAG: hypothetical protein L0191_09515 [Acidobacteria bacterium]|nr:hypothetical protein [Acidobacteriota bacterium]
MRIGIDLDDVLVDSLPHYLTAFNRRFGMEVSLADAAWRMYRRYPHIPRGEIDNFFSGLIEAGFFASRPLLPGAMEALERLTEEGHGLFIITGRAPQDEAITRKWLNEAGLTGYFSALVHEGIEPVGRYKSEAALELRLDLFVEDELAAAIAVGEARIPVLLYDQPWNRGALPANVRRVCSWSEALRQIAELNGGG